MLWHFLPRARWTFLAKTIKKSSEQMVENTRTLVSQIGTIASQSSIKALDLKSREAIERLTVETARDVAAFLYNRDEDIRLAATLELGQRAYNNFLKMRLGGGRVS